MILHVKQYLCFKIHSGMGEFYDEMHQLKKQYLVPYTNYYMIMGYDLWIRYYDHFIWPMFFLDFLIFYRSFLTYMC